MAMTEIEEKSIRTQLKLLNNIADNYRGIIYHVTTRGKEIRELLATKKINEAENTITLSKENFDTLLSIAYILQDENRFDQLGILAKSAAPDNKKLIEILNSLR